jgi:hypothetical protein
LFVFRIEAHSPGSEDPGYKMRGARFRQLN